ncbi:MAG: hypothetical protein ACI81R_000883, partial [Bradymonadia bacterium]
MPSGRFTRFLIIALSLSLVVGAVALFAGPSLVSGAVETKLQNELAARDLPLRVGELDLGRTQSTLSEVCLEAPAPANGDIVCVYDIKVGVDLVDLAQGNVSIHSIDVARVVVDASSERGSVEALTESLNTLLEQAQSQPRDQSEGSGTPEARQPRQRIGLPETVSIASVVVNAVGHGQPVDSLTLRDVRLQLPGGALPSLGSTIAEGQSPTLTAALSVTAPFVTAMGLQIPESMQIEATLSSVGAPEISLRTPDQPFAYASGQFYGEPLQWTGLGFTGPTTVWVEGVTLGDPEIGAVERAEVRVRELTTSFQDLYLASLDLTGPRLTLRLDEAGAPDIASRLGLATTESPAEEDSGEPSDSEPEGGAAARDGTETGPESELVEGSGESATDNSAAAVAAEPTGLDTWAERRWFEQLPQQITITDGLLTVVPASGDPVVASDVDVTYAVRVLNTQMDVRTTLALLSGQEPAGSVDVTLVWDWAHSALELDAEVNALSLGALAELARPIAPWLTLSGTLDFETRFRQQEDRSIPNFTGRIALSDLVANIERGEGDDVQTVLEEDLHVPSASYAWEASKTRGDSHLVFALGDILVGEARATLTPTFLDLRLHRREVLSGIDMVFSLPRQPAQTILDAFPRALLGPVAEARMSGDIAWEFAFPIRWIEAEDGERVFDLDEPTIDDFHDENVTLEFLPESVDVRRLNHADSFVFRGPNDRINRTLNMPMPRGAVAEQGEQGEQGANTDGVPGWRSLERISYFLIAAQLYREDGRFFTNRGINWYQMRLVAEEAAHTGWFERGASTVSMQLVKNVFLTHERSIERKVQELFLTYWMTRMVAKARILEVYLNVIEWGPSINGVTEAANYYFGLAPAELNLAQGVWLASITPAPRRRAAQRGMGEAPEWQMGWVHRLMEGMADRNWITRSELAKGLEQPVRFITSALPVQPVPSAPDLTPSGMTSEWQG